MFDDKIVVESPGRLPGLVRTDNIRRTHFSRNPKIAEFLKSYKFVKEYGEGVNRMCEEMERVGLSDPEYAKNNFMLQTIIKNSNSKNSEIGIKNSEIGIKNSEIGIKNSEIEIKNPENNNLKISFSKVNLEIEKKNYNLHTKEKLIRIYNSIETNQVFSSTDIMKIIDCAPSTAALLKKKLREMQIVEEVKGLGKGKVKFISEN